LTGLSHFRALGGKCRPDLTLVVTIMVMITGKILLIC